MTVVTVDCCPMCGTDDRRILFEDPPHTVMRCGACTMVWVTPRLSGEALRHVYDEGYWSSDAPRSKGYADYRRDERLYLKTFRKRLAFVGPHLGLPGRLLDVGCAAGFFMQAASEAGWQVDGVELSPEISAYARDRFGFEDIHVGTLDTAPVEPGSFDVVTMWDVVEHVPDPQSLLRQAHVLLRPDGRLVISTQNVDSPFAKLLGRRWHHYKHDEHLYHFNHATIRQVHVDAGFEVTHLTPRLAGKYVSVSFIAERSTRIHPAVGKALSPFTRLHRANVYVNFRDEMIVVSQRVEGS
ncbi:MAG: class I SAM-dependent methyltransferase [Acidimicrobiales bacterium]